MSCAGKRVRTRPEHLGHGLDRVGIAAGHVVHGAEVAQRLGRTGTQLQGGPKLFNRPRIVAPGAQSGAGSEPVFVGLCCPRDMRQKLSQKDDEGETGGIHSGFSPPEAARSRLNFSRAAAASASRPSDFKLRARRKW